MSFKDLDEFPTLKLPIKGKTYVIPSPDAQTGLWVQGKMAAVAAARAGQAPDSEVDAVLDDDQERDLHERILGPAHQELLDDGVPWHTLKRVGATAVLWIMYGEEIAKRFWNDEGDNAPKAPAKRAAKKSASAARQA